MPSKHGPKVEAFYHSKEWRRCQSAFRNYKNNTCEMCRGPGWLVHHKKPLNELNVDNPKISLNWSNLMLLCLDCHNTIHSRMNKEGQEIKHLDVEFDSDGNVVVKDKNKPIR